MCRQARQPAGSHSLTHRCRSLQGTKMFLFFESKNSVTMQGDIGVASSHDGGATWTPLGIALDEDWHLSYPYVFQHDGQVSQARRS